MEVDVRMFENLAPAKKNFSYLAPKITGIFLAEERHVLRLAATWCFFFFGGAGEEEIDAEKGPMCEVLYGICFVRKKWEDTLKNPSVLHNILFKIGGRAMACDLSLEM